MHGTVVIQYSEENDHLLQELQYRDGHGCLLMCSLPVKTDQMLPVNGDVCFVLNILGTFTYMYFFSDLCIVIVAVIQFSWIM